MARSLGMDELPTAMSHDQWAALFGRASRSLTHLELRDSYAMDYESERYRAWVAAGRPDRLPREEHPWWELIASTVRRGVEIRRVRVVSEPVSEYIAFEHAATWQNVESGEHVRWVPRRLTSAVALPGNDCWIVDEEQVMFTVFDGEGRPAIRQFTVDEDVVRLCSAAVARLWDHGVSHEDYFLPKH